MVNVERPTPFARGFSFVDRAGGPEYEKRVLRFAQRVLRFAQDDKWVWQVEAGNGNCALAPGGRHFVGFGAARFLTLSS